MSVKTQESEYKLRDIVDKTASVYLAELREFREQPSLPASELATQEFNFHYGSSGKRRKNDPGYNLADVATAPLNNLFPGYKILSDRTQDYLYEKALDKLVTVHQEWFTMEFAQLITTNRLDGLIKWLVFRHPSIEEFMRPLATAYKEFISTKIDRIDAIPGPAQKSPEWFAARQNAISASIAGYADSEACRVSIGEEAKQVREKTDLETKKQFNSASHPLKHGCNYEGLTENFYSTIKGFRVGEYGLIIDPHVPHIGASPDGIVLDTNPNPKMNEYQEELPNSYMNLKRHGRMLEIKNPTSRAIDRTIPSYYYWQMLQQMWVCQLPFCDFLQTKFVYPNECTWDKFYADSFDFAECMNQVSSWSQLYNYFAGYILDNVNYDNLIACYNLENSVEFDHLTITQLPKAMASYFCCHFQSITGIPESNLNRRGQIKGVLRAYMKGNYDEIASKYPEFTVSLANQADVEAMIAKWDAEMAQLGFVPEKLDFWCLDTYLLTEVEYNGLLYDNGTADCVLARLSKLWEFIMELRSIPDMEERRAKYLARYPESEYAVKKRLAAAASAAKPTVVYMLD